MRLPIISETFIRDLSGLERYTIPSLDILEEEECLLQLTRQEFPQKLHHGLVVGRFQPLHYGHLYLFKQASNIASQITIVIGSANIRNQDNPYSAEERFIMLWKALKREGMLHHVADITISNDHEDDDIWLNEILLKTKGIDTVIGNNSWVNNTCQRRGIKAIEIPLLKRNIYEGRKVREELRALSTYV